MHSPRFIHTATLLCLGILAWVPPAARAQDAPLVAPTEALSPAEQQKLFKLPPGFHIELVASEPEIQKPMNLAFDAAGRLFVTQSIEYPFPAREGEPRDTIRVITDTNGDGVPDKVSKFATGLNIPIGVLPLVNSEVLAYSIPRIERFSDTTGAGAADRREPLFGAFGFDDTHGMASSFNWWLDGWVYACHGFRNTSAVAGSDEEVMNLNSGNTYRFRPDGSRIEQFTWGQVNPFGMAFDALGNVFTADCHSRPIYMLLKGAYYPSFGKPHDGLGYGPEMIKHSHGSTGICGLVYYDSSHFPASYRDTVFIGNPVTGRINHDRLAPTGSSFEAVEQPDFLSCGDLWFRPVDIKLAPDGSLYVADFYNCIIGHYEVDLYHPRRDREKGRIWRITYRGEEGAAARTVNVANLAQSPLPELFEALGHESLVVRTMATHQAVARIQDADLPVARKLLESQSALTRAHALWVLLRRGGLELADLRRLVADPDRIVRVHAAKALAAVESSRFALARLELARDLLEDSDPFVQRAAAETLGQIPDAASAVPLLELWRKTPGGDTHLIHATRIALRNCLKPEESWAGLAARAVQVNPGHLARLADVSLGSPTAAAGRLLTSHLGQEGSDPNRMAEFAAHAARHLPPADLASLYQTVDRQLPPLDVGRQVGVVRGLAQALQARQIALPPFLRNRGGELAAQLLQGQADDELKNGAELARDLRVVDAQPRLREVALNSARPVPLRQLMLEVLNSLNGEANSDLLQQLIRQGTEAVPVRQKASELLGGQGSPASREALLKLLPEVPDPVGVAIARSLASGAEGANALMTALEHGKASTRLVQDIIVAERLKGQNHAEVSTRLASLMADLPTEDDRVRQLLAARRDAYGKATTDAGMGRQVFSKICANCHRAEGQGAKVGPDLDGIGQRGLERLLEDVLLPSRNVDQAFRSTVIELKSGKTVSGLLAREEVARLILIDEQGREFAVESSEIAERRVLRISPMPANIAEQLPEGEFLHLVKYLLSLRTQPTVDAGKAE